MLIGVIILVIFRAPFILSSAIVNGGVLDIARLKPIDVGLFKSALRSDPLNARANAYLGQHEFLSGNMSSAIPYLRDAITQQPNNSLTGLYLGIAYQSIGETQLAIGIWQQVHAENYFLSLGQQLLIQGDPESAQEQFSTALMILPGSFDARFGITKCLQSLGNHLSAIKLLLDLVAEFPKSVPVHQAIFTSYLALKDYASASLWDEKTAELVSADYAPLYRGRAYLYLGDYNHAIEELKRAAQLDAKNDYPYYLLCLAYRNQGDLRSAELACQKRIELSQKPSASYYVDLADIFLESGNMVSARNTYEQALRISPNDPDAMAGIRRISP